MSDLFIPKKIKIGFVERAGTYTGRLAYVIYYDNKGVLRKEKSWETWRDKKIEPQEFDNNPQDGFCLNKDVKRFNWSHFGSNRSYIRMYDPRGIEFEVTPENLIGILTETDCLKRGLEGKFVYAWKGTELVLLPCASEEFVKAKEHTKRQDQDISARDLKPGHSYTTKKGEEVIYIGRFPWFEWNIYDNKGRKAEKQHIFANPKTPGTKAHFFKKSDAKFLAVLNSSDPVMNYAELIDEWNQDSRSSEIANWEIEPVQLSREEILGSEKAQNNFPYIGVNHFVEKIGDIVNFWIVRVYKDIYKPDKPVIYSCELNGTLNIKTMIYSWQSYLSPTSLTEDKIINRIQKSIKLTMVLSSGYKKQITSIHDI